MSESNLSTLTKEELTEKTKSIKRLTGFFIGLLIVFIGAAIFLFFRGKQNIALLILPVAFLPILLINLANLKKYTIELAKRN